VRGAVESIVFNEPPQFTRRRSVIILPPGAATDIPLKSRRGEGNFQYLAEHKLGEVKHSVRLLRVSEPGQYRLRVRYRYSDDDQQLQGVYQATLKSNWVRFSVQ